MRFYVSSQKGFTLLEVLVALAVLAIGMGSVLKVSANHASQVTYLKSKTIALYVAKNRVNQVLLTGWPNVGRSNGTEIMANQEWKWNLTVSNTADKDLRRLDVEVAYVESENEPLVKFIAFHGKETANSQ